LSQHFGRALRERIGQLEHRVARRTVEVSSKSDRGVDDPSLSGMRLLRLAEVRQLVGLGNSSIYKKVSEGRFPAPIKIGTRAVRWHMREVLAWQEQPG
jgi:prophage regulatory protein